jgi:hypothetical protein
MKKSIVLYSISVLMFCFGIYVAQYRCRSSTLLNNFCQWNAGEYNINSIYPATFIFLSILIAVMTFIKQDDL